MTETGTTVKAVTMSTLDVPEDANYRFPPGVSDISLYLQKTPWTRFTVHMECKWNVYC